MEKKIDIVIITGFLGAGKTTLLNKLVASYSGQNIGLLVNDFGQVPIDGSLIKNSCEDLNDNKIYEIGNGSIFCSCLTSSFVFGLRYFIGKSPDVLFIETSGMSDPSSMAGLLNDYKLWDAYRIRHVLSVVDCTSVLKLRKNMAFVDRQINSSNTVLLNKADLITGEMRSLLNETISEINGDARIEFTEYCEFDYSSLQFEAFRLEGDAQSCNTSANAPKTLNLPQYEVSEDPYLTFLGSLVDKTLRLKGFYRFGKRQYYISNNNGLLEVKDIHNEIMNESGITLIYEDRYHDEILESWQSFKTEHSL